MGCWAVGREQEGGRKLKHHRGGRTIGSVPWRLGLFMAWLVMAAQSPPAHAETQTVEFFPTADTYIKRGNPNRNHGTEAVLQVGSAGNRRTLIRFDEDDIRSTLEAGIVESARLRLYIADSRGGPGVALKTVDVYGLTTAWTEKGATWSCPDDPNGNPRADCADLWNGGLFETAPLASVTHPGRRTGWISFDVTSELERILTGGSHEGWILRNGRGAGGLIEYTAREGNPEFVPRLEVVFRPAPPANQPPAVCQYLHPTDGALLIGKTPLRLSVAAFDIDDEIARVEFFVDDELIGQDLTAPWAFLWSVPDAGTFTLSARAFDTHGATLASKPVMVSVEEDATPPTVVIQKPLPDVLLLRAPVSINVNLSDDSAGIDPDSVKVLINGAEQPCRAYINRASCLVEELSNGEQLLDVIVRDLAGNETVAHRRFDFRLDTAPPTIQVDHPANGAIISAPWVEVTGRVLDDGVVSLLEVNGQPVQLAEGEFSVTVALDADSQSILLMARDSFNRLTVETRQVFRDIEGPDLDVFEPADGARTNTDSAVIRGRAYDPFGIQTLTVDGIPTEVNGVLFETVVALRDGDNVIQVEAIDNTGNTTALTRTIVRQTIPSLTLAAPQDGSLIQEDSVLVIGQVDDADALVTVNGTVANRSGPDFSAEIPLSAGLNHLVVIATNGAGLVSSTGVTVVRDLSPPVVTIAYPLDGEVVTVPRIPVSGHLLESMVGIAGMSGLTVTVNGQPAQVAQGSFLATEIPLSPGDNSILAIATDSSGNSAEAEIGVRFEPPITEILEIVSGNLQSGRIGEPLVSPLVVRVIDALGAPLPGRSVEFRLDGNNGRLNDNLRQVAALTDSQGQAAVTFRLGTRAGLGVQQVTAATPGLPPIRFVASALVGEPALLVIDSGNQQIGTAGQELPRSLVAVVTDAGFNRLPDVPVTFEVVEGDGHFAGGATSLQVTTNDQGQARARWRLDALPRIGTNVVAATTPGPTEDLVVAFVATGRAAGPPSETRLLGVVLDNADQPVPGTTLRIRGTPLVTRADLRGHFLLEGVPPGFQMLDVDGSTTDRLGSWPALEFELEMIPGQDNTLGRPIYLLSLNLLEGRLVDESQGVVLRLKDVPGFALEIEPGAATFPDGTQSGTVSVTAVHADKIPMTPNFGQQPRFVVTIQPAGTHFDPPARLSLPNVDGLEPGEVTEMYSFDHDLGQFLSIGLATVSEDGTTIRSNPGYGVRKAGWHCGGNPSSSGTPHNCAECKVCDGIRCIPGCPLDGVGAPVLGPSKATCECDDGDMCTNTDRCSEGKCQGFPFGSAMVTARANGKENFIAVETPAGERAPITLSAELEPLENTCESPTYLWKGSGGSGVHLGNPATITLPQGLHLFDLEVACKGCRDGKLTDSVIVEVYEVHMRLEQEGEIEISTDGKYSEDARIRVTAVKGYNGETIRDFTGTAMLEEITNSQFPSRYGQNGGDLPPSVLIGLGGTTLITARSLAGPDLSGTALLFPAPASIESTNYPVFGGQPLQIDQWVTLKEGAGRALGSVVDWLEAMVDDVWDDFGDAGPVGTALALFEGFRMDQLIDAIGQVPLGHQPDSHVMSINPLVGGIDLETATQFRLNGEFDRPCVSKSSVNLVTNTIVHEARHGFQDMLSTLDGAGTTDDRSKKPNNDDDGDWLVEFNWESPIDVTLDTTTERDVCIQPTDTILRVRFKGDNQSDNFEDGEGGTGFKFALEMDANQFSVLHSP